MLKQEMFRAVAYARFSSEMQRGESIDAQVRAIAEYAKKNGYTLVHKQKVIDKYLSSKLGAKAVMLMFSEPDVDLGLWTKDIYAKAFMKSKTQAELDFEIKKQEKVNQLKLEKSEQFNIGNLLAAQRIMQGNPERGMPSLENVFDNEIRQVYQMMDNERKAIKEEVKRELMREGAVNEQTESN